MLDEIKRTRASLWSIIEINQECTGKLSIIVFAFFLASGVAAHFADTFPKGAAPLNKVEHDSSTRSPSISASSVVKLNLAIQYLHGPMSPPVQGQVEHWFSPLFSIGVGLHRV